MECTWERKLVYTLPSSVFNSSLSLSTLCRFLISSVVRRTLTHVWLLSAAWIYKKVRTINIQIEIFKFLADQSYCESYIYLHTTDIKIFHENSTFIYVAIISSVRISLCYFEQTYTFRHSVYKGGFNSKSLPNIRIVTSRYANMRCQMLFAVSTDLWM